MSSITASKGTCFDIQTHEPKERICINGLLGLEEERDHVYVTIKEAEGLIKVVKKALKQENRIIF